MIATARSIALGLLLASLSSCDSPSTSDPREDEIVQSGISPSAVRWVLDWGAVSNDEQGFTLINDLGYRVRVEAGWIGSWGVTLVECSEDEADADADAERRPTTELGVASPWLIAEGHASGEDDPSAWVFAGVESLIEQRTVEADPIASLDARYCEVHYLLGPIGETSEGFAAAASALAQIDPEASLVGASVLILGSWEPPGGGEPTPFVLRSEQAYGKILALDSAAVESAGGEIEVVLTRELASMFDQVDFATAELEDAAWTVLGNLAKLASADAQPV